MLIIMLRFTYKSTPLLLLMLLLAAPLFSQNATTAASVTVGENGAKESVKESVEFIADPQLAMSMPNYPVTAGDIYTLAFAAGATPVQYTIPVDVSYKIRIANLGQLNCKGLTYSQLKAQVDHVVRQNYPMAGMQFVLTSPSVFLVSIAGEVNKAAERKAWALTRLSSFLSASLTPYSSTRNVTVVAADGSKRVYDLYLAQRRGDFSQDPYLRPGDKIVLARSERTVWVSGAVERGGRYELLAGENLRELIADYASGMTQTADARHIRVVRIAEQAERLQKVLYVTGDDIASNFALMNGDHVFVPDWSELQPYIIVKGVIRDPITLETTSNGNEAQSSAIYSTKVPFYLDESYSSLIRRIKQLFTAFSDIAGIYIERGDERLALEADKILADGGFESPHRVATDDVLIVPYLPVFAK